MNVIGENQVIVPIHNVVKTLRGALRKATLLMESLEPFGNPPFGTYTQMKGDQRKRATSPDKSHTKSKDNPIELMVSKMPISPRGEDNTSVVSNSKPEPLSPVARSAPNVGQQYLLLMDVVDTMTGCIESLECFSTPNVKKAIVKALVKDKVKEELVVFNDSKIDQAYAEYLSIHNIEVLGEDSPNGNRAYEEADKKKLLAYCEKLSDHIHFQDKKNVFKTLQNFGSWGFDILSLATFTNNRPLTTAAFTLFKERNICARFQIHNDLLIKTFMKIEDAYHNNLPYHTSKHAADVMCSTNYILSCSSLKNMYTEMEIFAALFASAVHDIDHPACTNPYLVKIKSNLAQLYNNTSPLENHHIAVAFKVIGEEKNILSSLSARDLKVFRNIVSTAIISTDPAVHLKLYLEIKSLVKVIESGTLLIDNENRLNLMHVIVHCADIGNPLKPLELYKFWVDGIMTEFFRQGDRERQRQMEISPLCDRQTVDVAKSQVGFIDFVVQPIWDELASYVGEGLESCLEHLSENRNYFANNSYTITRVFPDYKENKDI